MRLLKIAALLWGMYFSFSAPLSYAQNMTAKLAVCGACHGADGKGNPALGAPNLTDDIWLHGYGEQAVINMVTAGKTNIMPAQESKLSAAQIHVLSSYVWGLSNGAQ